MTNDSHAASFFQFNPDVFCRQTASQLNVSEHRLRGAVRLLDDGNTIPFIARYRKEATQGLDERQLRDVEDLLGRARELAARKNTILRTLGDQGTLTAELRSAIERCTDPRRLEDLYLPFRPKKRTRAALARERGLQPLAEKLLSQQSLSVPRSDVIRPFIRPENDVPDEAAALQGACDIVAEFWADDSENRGWMLEKLQCGELASVVRKGKLEAGQKFENYFDCSEKISRVPSHRLLAMRRGAAEGILKLSVRTDDEHHQRQLTSRLIRNPDFEFRRELEHTAVDCYDRLLRPAAENQLMQLLKEKADAEAIAVFARNLRDLLMTSPAGPQVTVGIDPGFRTGCKVAVVDETGRFLCSETIYPTPPRQDIEHASAILLRLIRDHQATLIAIGNGTASRETDKFVSDLIRQQQLNVTKVLVSEAGASVYSASETAAAEYPDLDLTVRGAISIAHRLQDPLAELVKIDPQSIGVGQYQHDVDQPSLKKALDREVESCVNSVGVDANTASPALLSYVAGIGPTLAKRIVAWRNEHGAFRSRREILNVPRLGAKLFQQAAGFLRIRNSSQPLDNSAVHPEQYPLVQRMAQKLGIEPQSLVGNLSLVQKLKPEEFISPDTGEYTIRDVLSELARPGLDPRSEFRAVRFADAVSELEHLQPEMLLEGIITNVTRFGAFVDIGVHLDGLIHISQLADHFVQDPSDEVSVGEIVRVRVLEVDTAKKRISLSRRAK